MKILSRKLTAHVEDYGYGEGPELGGWWCSGWDDTIFAEHLAELWDIPPEVRMIWISLHTTKSGKQGGSSGGCGQLLWHLRYAVVGSRQG